MAVYCLLCICVMLAVLCELHTRVGSRIFQIPRVLYHAALYLVVLLLFDSYQYARASGDTALSSPCWDLLATMRRVVNYHSSWARQRQVELFDASGNPGFTAGRDFNPAGGAPGGG
ncbi:hypothetical protein F511_04551 [Dorcoceras hygrometricum]|uniref:Uncharacterized protein n=1 Tax=Dorcoceras hygrometricum TaxID=472368 RepID=A0A2Z7A596_9LAMI|nr:hypothetical protein F511_04551 [Dorcoceras hygrometricum]